MSKVDLPYVQRLRDRHGKLRHYFRRRGFQSATLPGKPGSDEFMEAYRAALSNQQHATLPSAPPGSFNSLFNAYYASREFKKQDPHTQRTYRSNVNDFMTRFGRWPYAGFTRAALETYLDERSSSPGAAANFLKRIKQVLAFGVRREMLNGNVAALVKFDRAKTDGFPDWTENDITAFEEKWPVTSKERLAFALLLYTGQRRSDVVRMGRQHVTDGRIAVRQVKGGRNLFIPLHGHLRVIIDALPKSDMTFLLTEYGKPFNVAGFGAWFARACEGAGVHKRAHGLRKAAARRMAEAGCTAYEIIAVTGHSSAKEAEPYTRAADQVKLAEAAMRKVRRTKV